MAETPKLDNPRIRVVLDDASEHIVQTLNVDLVAYDRERGRHKDWPAGQDAVFFWSNYLAWHALTRTNTIARMTLPEFEQRALECRPLGEDDKAAGDGDDEVGGAGDGVVDPIPTAPGPG